MEKELIKLMEKFANDGYNETSVVIPEHKFKELAEEIKTFLNNQ